MRKTVFIIVSILAFCFLDFTAFAADANSIYPINEETEMNQIQQTIVASGEMTVADLALEQTVGPKIDANDVISLEDIPAENLTKVYRYIDLLSVKELKESELKNSLVEDDCEYIAQITISGNTFYEVMKIQKEPTEADIKTYEGTPVIDNMRKHIGEYVFEAGHLTYGIINYNQAIDQSLSENKIDNANVYLIRDYDPFLQRLFAVCFPQESEAVIIVFQEKTNKEFTKTEIVSTVYSLEEFQQAEFNRMSDTEAYGGTVKKSDIYKDYIRMSGIGLLVITVSIIIVFIKRKRKKT